MLVFKICVCDEEEWMETEKTIKMEMFGCGKKEEEPKKNSHNFRFQR